MLVLGGVAVTRGLLEVFELDGVPLVSLEAGVGAEPAAVVFKYHYLNCLEGKDPPCAHYNHLPMPVATESIAQEAPSRA